MEMPVDIFHFGIALHLVAGKDLLSIDKHRELPQEPRILQLHLKTVSLFRGQRFGQPGRDSVLASDIAELNGDFHQATSALRDRRENSLRTLLGAPGASHQIYAKKTIVAMAITRHKGPGNHPGTGKAGTAWHKQWGNGV